MGAVESVVQKEKKKTPSRLALAYVTHDDVVRTWRLSPGPDLSRIATQLSSDRIHDAVRFRIGMEGGEGGRKKKVVESEAIISYYYYSRFRREPWRFRGTN